jgi:hypothetical protein
MTTRQIAQGIAQLGRHGDSTLMHVTPHEVAGLQALAQTQGTSLTVNPQTGLPEAFNLGGFFRSLAPTLAGAAVSMIPGMQPFGLSAMQAGILAGAGTGALLNKKDPLMGAVMGGMGGYGGANLATAAGSFGKQAAAAGVDPQIAAVQSGFNAIPTNVGANMANPSAAFTGSTGQMGVNMGATNMVKPVTYNTASTGFGSYSPHLEGAIRPDLFPEVVEPSALSKAASGFADNASNAFSNVAQDPLGFIGQNKMAVGMPLGMAALSGLEPSDLYGEQMRPGQNPNERYDPYRSLNLNTDTGLRLYAQGGPVSFADGGDTQKDQAGLPGGGLESLKGGDAGAMQGAGMLPLDVSDINAKFGISGQGGFIPVPKLGLFADNDQIESARTAYEAQLAAAMSGRGGMGSPYGFGGMGRGMTGMGTTGMNRMGGNGMVRGGVGTMGMDRMMGTPANTAPTARTAETSLSRLNLNKTYANGGTIQAGGLQDLYQTSDNPSMNPTLSRDGYGLGRLQAMADGGVAGYAKGGETRYTLDRNTLGGKMFGDTGVVDQLPPSAIAQILNNPGMRQFMGFRGVEEPKFYSASGMSGGNGALSTVGPRVNLNTASGLGMAKGGYLDGEGDGMSDSIPATIEGKQPARLADGEFVIPADVVSHLGNGSTKAGSKRLYAMLDKVRHARTGNKKQGKQIKPEKYMPA